MPKAKLFDEDSEEEEVKIKTENEYAKRYDAWREKEELHKLEQKYGNKPLNSDGSESDSEDESDEPPEVSEEVEKQFLKTLALLKTKDPRIYDPNYKFFDEKIEKEKEKEPETKKLTFGDSDDDDDDDPNIFSIEKKAEIDSDDDKKNSKGNSKDDKIKEFLTGKVDHVDDEVEKDLAPLRALWSDPKLNDGEAFLRDYILNKRYLEDGDVGDAADKVRDDDDLEEDEKTVEEQGKFERAYNFRFEEPDDEYLKRFPRTMNYIRPKDDRRSRKRAEIRERKEEEKKRKMEEIARLKALKLKEIQEKIAKIKEVTGNKDLAFKDEDIEGDFDPEEHDRRMKALFDEEYYGEVDDQKPVFPDLDEELEIENWENYEQEYEQNDEYGEDEPHCEDKDFNMDADYDPKKAKENLLEELKRNMGKKRRNRKRKSKLAEILSEEKPKFIPDIDKTYAEYMNEYYQMDCEDVIGGDLPTRFKYREVVPNDYGLTVEEILLADDKELTQWVPLKKIVKYRPENVEKGEVKTYSQKAADVRLKQKILPSLFKELPEEPELVVPVEVNKKKKKKKKKQKNTENNEEQELKDEINNDDTQTDNTETPKKKKKHKHKENDANDVQQDTPQDTSNESKKNKKKHKNNTESENANVSQEEGTEKVIENGENANTQDINNKSKKSKKKHKNNSENDVNITQEAIENVENGISQTISRDFNNESKNNKKKHKNKIENDSNASQVNKHIDNVGTELTPTIPQNIINDIKNNKKKRKNTDNSNKELNVVDESKPFNISNDKQQKVGKKKKNKPINPFNIEKPNTGDKSQDTKVNSSNNESNKNNLKRKLSTTEENVPKKKKKKNKNKQVNNVQQNSNNKKDFKKFKANKNKQNDKTDNPLSKLSDERLKAYGLNPKKYRSFLKYKKF